MKKNYNKIQEELEKQQIKKEIRKKKKHLVVGKSIFKIKEIIDKK